MKKNILKIKFYILLFLCTTTVVFSQAKKPTIMVVPSKTWCSEHGYMREFDNQGTIIRIPDYQRALDENKELKAVIGAIGNLMAERGFELKLLEATLNTIASENAENSMLNSKSGASVSETPIDKLRKTAKADIWMDVDWTLKSNGPKKYVNYMLTGIDAYTDKQIAGGMIKKGNELIGVDEVSLVKTAILSDIDGFNADLMAHFDKMFKEGREIILRVKKFDSFSGDLESEYGGDELKNQIEKWVTDNTVSGRNSLSDATENMMLFEQVKIPLYDANNKATDARKWAVGLQKYLKDTFQIESKVMTKGLGQAVIVIGEK